MQIFISYANKDKIWINRLVEHLTPLKEQSIINIWFDTNTSPGENWDNKILHEINQSDIFILLISPSYLASSYIRQKEMPLILNRWSSGLATIMTIHIKPCALEYSVYKYIDNKNQTKEFIISDIQALNTTNEVLCSMDEGFQESLFTKLTNEVAKQAKANFDNFLKPNPSKVECSTDISIIDSYTIEVLIKKLKLNFLYSVIKNRDQAELEIDKTKHELNKALLLVHELKDIRLPLINVLKLFPNTKDLLQFQTSIASWCIHIDAWKGRLRPIVIDHLQVFNQIRFGSASIHPSIQACLIFLMKNGLNLSIDSSAKHGIDIICSIEERNQEYDFMVLADANMFQCGYKNSMNYRYLMPIFRQPHFFISKKETLGNYRHIIIAKNSTAEHQLKLGIEMSTFCKTPDFVEIDQLPSIISNLEFGQTVLAWEPLRSALAASSEFSTYQSKGFQLSTSLYCNKRLWQEHMEKPLPIVGAFMEAFIASWNYMSNNRMYAAAYLASDKDFMREWRIGSGT